MDPVALCVLQALLVLMILPPAAPAPCPRPCSCPQPNELHCTFRSLSTIPLTVSKQVRRMNLGFNSINNITDKSLAGLTKLELLMVHGNDIHSLPDGVFRDLNSLQMLKISYNKLKEINRHTLHGIWALARLHLDHNQLEFIHPDSFHGLTSLRLLQLEGNRLQQLHPATFTTFTLMGLFHISTLRHLYLSDNELMSLPSRLVATMPQLENLYLHGNLWTCDCNLSWLKNWDENSPDVLKCKKDRALPGGQLCPMCSSPMKLQGKELQAVENLICSRPLISSPQRTPQPDDTESEIMTLEDFSEPFGNMSLGLSDEHGNEVDLECSIGEPKELTKINLEQINQLQLMSNITLSVDIECPVNREKYEQLWKLIAYYSNVPAHLKRDIMLGKEPHQIYVYRQDSEKDAQYYTGIKVNIRAQPAWLLQTTAGLQLNRLQSSAKMVKLILSTEISETVEVELVRTQMRSWAMIESKNKTRKVYTAMLGSPSEMYCNVHSSGHPVIQWMLPDGSKVEAPYSSADNRVSVSSKGRIVIKAVRHTDTGIYYCIARVHRDLTVLPLQLTVQESSSPPPGEDASITHIEGFAGSPISIPCMSSGSPNADINWILPSNNIISLQTNSSRALVNLNGTLHIQQAQPSDSGHYKCIAINQHGVDTLATKVIVTRRKGLVGPLKKFPGRPQSASGINTQFKFPTDDTVEASGDIEDTQGEASFSHSDPSRRRIPGHVGTGRRGVQPTRNMRRRPQVLRKAPGTRFEDKKNIVESRRKINISKTKIDPEKWADILAKIRDKNALNTVTPPPVQHTAGGKLQTQHTQSTHDQSSNTLTTQGIDGQEYFATTLNPIQTKYHEQNQRMQATSNSYTAMNSHDMITKSQFRHIVQATEVAQITQTTQNVQHTTPDVNLDLHTTSNSVLFLPHTTSAPLHTVIFWQTSTNIVSSSRTNSPKENHGTNKNDDGVKTTDLNLNIPNVASANNNRERSSSGNQNIPLVNTDKSEISQEGNGNYLSETTTASQWHTETKDTQQNDLETTAFPTATLVVTSARRRGARLHKPNSRRNNRGRQRRPNRRNWVKPTQFIATTHSIDPHATLKPTSRSSLKIEPLQLTTIHFTTVPLSGSQTMSPDRPSHEQGSVSGLGAEAATIFSSQPVNLPKINSSLVTLAKPLFTNPSAVPSFPTSYPGVDQRMAGSQRTIGISESASDLDLFTLTTQQSFTDNFPALLNPLEETQRASFLEDPEPALHSYNSSEGFHTVTEVQTDVGLNQSALQYTQTENVTKMPSKDADINFSVLPSPSASDALSIEHKIETTSAHTSGRLMTSKSMHLEHDLETKQVSLKDHSVPGESHHSSSQNKTTSSEQGNIESNVDVSITSIKITTHPPATSSKASNVFTPSTVVPYAMLSETPSTSPVEGVSDSFDFSLWTTTLPDSQSQNQQIQPIITSEPQRTSDSQPETLSSVHNPIPFSTATSPSLTLTSRQIATLFPTVSRQSEPFLEGLLKKKQDGKGKQQLPGPGSILRPRIIKLTSQTFTVNAGTDFQISCEAEGEPMPFLSWTKVANGVTFSQNTSVQRFEVYPNGTLIIRKVQPMDGGQYQCIVQNQYGTDQMMVSFVVLSQQPLVLLPRQKDVTVHLGGNAVLECAVEGHPFPRVTWVLPNRAHVTAAPHDFTLHQRVAVLSNGSLRISQVTYIDRGIYKCIGNSAAGVDTLSIHLHVSASQPVIQQAQNESITLPEGSAASIHCTATGAPQPLIRWITPDGIHLTTPEYVTGRNLNLFPNGTLYIQRLDPGKVGMYECLASNMVASSKRKVNLNIKRNPSSAKPSATAKASIAASSPQRTDVIYGERLLLNCVATGTPEPRIIWRTPSKKLVDAQYSFDPRIKVFPNGTITLHSVTDKDSGDYLCVARNKMGDDYVVLRVNVLTRPAKINQKQQQSNQEVIYGGDLKVDCVASGAPNPEISWALPDGTMVNTVKYRDISGGRSRRYVVFDNGTLYFNDVGMPEEGDYTCYAENPLGKDEMKVRVKIKVATSPPIIPEKAQKIVQAFYGETATLRCNARRESLITWISPTNKVISTALDKYQVLDDGTLVVQKVHRLDGGNYTCMTRNNGGQDHKVIRLEVLVTSPVINALSGPANTVNVNTVQDQRTFVDCAAEGIPTPRIIWVLPGNVILPAPYFGNRMTVHQNGTLEIQIPKRMDSGKLTCIARNEGGEVRLQVHLDVKEADERPQIKSHKTDSLLLTLGSTMTLNCSFDGSTKPHITWILPSGTPLHYGSSFSKFFHRPDGSLIISNPTAAEAGMYRCLGHTFQGNVERTFTLSPGRTPEINNRYNSPINIMNGEILLLNCVTSGDLFRLTWTLPSGVVLNMPQRAGRYAVLPNGTLAIQQVSVYDRGLYVCRASNEYGSSQISVSVTVIAYPPQITNGPPSVTYAKRGVAIQLNCIATGIPKVDVAWETPDKIRLAVSALPRLFGNKYLHPQGSLIIQNPTRRDTGVYRCTARNAVGTDSIATFLNVF